MKNSVLLRTLLVVCSASASAQAAGLYFSDRGVRPLGRGGAFVAGADDAGSIAYNPAGLAFTGNQLLFDASWLQYSSTYQRKSVVRDSAGNPVVLTYPAVEGTSPVLPIPTLAYSNNLGLERFNFALGAWAPYAAITSYPESVNGQPAPQRYSLITLDGSALAILGLYGSYQPSDEVALGAGIEMLTGYFQTSVAFSACVPDRFICAPEQPEYDAYSQLRVGPIFAPSGILGAILKPADQVRFGLSFHLPFWINSPATVKVRLPTAAAFDNASQRGEDANVKFNLPWTLRTGVEFRPVDPLRVEAAFGYEAWGMHDKIEVEPEGITLNNVAAFPQSYAISGISIERNFQNTFSGRLGAEYSLPVGQYTLDFRAGGQYEKSAIPNEYLSVTTVDLDKVTLSIGGGIHIGKWRFDGVYARVIGFTADVNPNDARIPQVNPVRANPPAQQNYINGGHYEASANVLGVGLAYQFDAPDEPRGKPAAQASFSGTTAP